MHTAHAIVASFCTQHAVDMQDFWEWFRESDHTQDEASVHDSRFLALLTDYVADRTILDNCIGDTSSDDDWTAAFDTIHTTGWQTIDDGLTERKVQIGEITDRFAFYIRVQRSCLGRESNDHETWHAPYPSYASAATAADRHDADHLAAIEDAGQQREDDAIRDYDRATHCGRFVTPARTL